MPRTSCPCSTSSAAAADESTPPLMATTTRIGALSPNTLPPRPPPGTPRVSNTSTAENALQGFGGVQRGVVEHGLQQRPGGRTDGRRGTDAQPPHPVRTAQGEVRRAEGRPGGKPLTHPRRELALGIGTARAGKLQCSLGPLRTELHQPAPDPRLAPPGGLGGQ